jgi:hypothetical protein
MSQYDFGTIVASTKSGPALASDLNAWRTALHSTHKGSTAPTYKVAGTPWLDDSGSPLVLKIYDGTDWIVQGYVDATANLFTPGIFFKKGASIASGATVDLATATGNFLHITGSTGPITSLGGSSLPAGLEFELVFDSTPIVTHNGTSLILLGGVSRTMAVNDVMRLRHEGSGNWREVDFNRGAASPSSWEKISDVTVSGVASIDFTGLSAYKTLRITGYALPATDASAFALRTDDNNGASFDAGASDYDYVLVNTTTSSSSAGANAIVIGTVVGNVSGSEGIHFNILITSFNSASVRSFVSWTGTIMTGVPALVMTQGSGRRLSTTAQNALQLFFSIGNIASGYATLEGQR